MSNEIVSTTENMLAELNMNGEPNNSIHVPISQIKLLGNVVVSAFDSFSDKSLPKALNSGTLYQAANVGANDVLKQAKDGTFWGAFKTSDGKSKMGKFKEFNPDNLKKAAPVNPALILMTASLYSLEKEIDKIEQMSKQIVSFLENEKQADIIGDVQTLLDILINYKYNWNNDLYLSSNHKLVCDIQRSARSNINLYQKKIADMLSEKKKSVTMKQTDELLESFMVAFKYYKMGIYSFSMATMLEIMISGNFTEEYIENKINDIQGIADSYREMFEKGSVYIERISSSTISNNVFKGIGKVSGTAGKLFSSIPVIKNGSVPKKKKKKSEDIKSSTEENDSRAVRQFAELNNPQTRIIIDKLDEIIRINKSKNIMITDDSIYLLPAN